MSQQQPGPFSKTEKILALQEELLNLRRQISNKQAHWQKQKNQYLSKHEILSMEVIELRQRLSNLSQINEALMHALNDQEVTEETMNGIKCLAESITGHRTSNPSKDENGPSSTTNQSQDLEKLKYALSEKNAEIKRLNKKINEFESLNEHRIKGYENHIQELKKKVNERDEEILNYNKEISHLSKREQELTDRIDQLQLLFQKNQATLMMGKKKQLSLHELQHPFKNGGGNTEHRSSSYLLLKPTTDSNNTSYYHEIQFSPDQDLYEHGHGLGQQEEEEEEEQKLLCQVCERVFNVCDFQRHMNECAQTHRLYDKKRGIESKLQTLRRQEQKQNKRYLMKKQKQKQREAQLDYRHSNADKVSEIQSIMKEYGKKFQNYRKKPESSSSSSYSKFSIKNFNYD